MSWREETRERFAALATSHWAPVLGLMFLVGPLLGFVSLFGDGRAPGDEEPLVLAKYAVLQLSFLLPQISGVGVVALAFAGALAPAAGRRGVVGAVLGATLALAAIASITWLLPVMALGGWNVGWSIVLPALIAFGILLLEIAAWIAIYVMLQVMWPRVAAPATLAAWFLFQYLLSYLTSFLWFFGGRGAGAFGEVPSWGFPLTFVSPSLVSQGLQGAMLPSEFDPMRESFLESHPDLYGPAIYFLAALAWIAVPLVLAAASARRAEEDAADLAA